jgi:hypothetical protein
VYGIDLTQIIEDPSMLLYKFIEEGTTLPWITVLGFNPTNDSTTVGGGAAGTATTFFIAPQA